MNKSFLISNTTSIVIGIAGTLATLGLTAVASTPLTVDEVVNIQLGAKDKTALESLVASALCPTVDEKRGYGTCKATDHITGLCFQWQRGADVDTKGTEDPTDDTSTPYRKVQASARFSVPGSWIAGTPQ